MSLSDAMLVAKPAPEEKIRELASVIARARPEISVDGFLLPRDVSSNFQWNTLSTSNQSLMLDWYVSVVAPSRGLAAEDPDTKRILLEDLLGDILTNPNYAVVVNNERVPLTVNYLLKRDNWFSHAAGVAINKAISARLGPHYSDIHVVLSPKNPWIEVVHFVLGKEGQGAGIIEKIARLKGGPREVYRDVIFDSAFFSRTRIFEALGDIPLGFGRRRTNYRVHWTNYYYAVPEGVGWYHAILSYIPLLFAQHPLLRRIPGFNLRPADVRFEFPDGDYSGTWEITIDYDVTPIDRVRSWFNVGELQETVATLSAEVLELQRDRKALTEEAERLAGRLVEEEKARRVYQVRAAQADAVARFLHQTSNLVLQPLASMMIVFEDFIEIVEDCRTEWEQHQSDEVLFQELDEGLARVQEVYPSASRVIEGYRKLFQAFYEVYVSTESQRDLNQDLRYIETLVRNKYILTQVELSLELEASVPPLLLAGGVQSIFLELMHNAARHGAKRLLVKTAYEPEAGVVQLFFYNDGEPMSAEEGERALRQGVGEEGRGFGLADARYIIETLNGGRLRLVPSDREDFSVLFIVDLKIATPHLQ